MFIRLRDAAYKYDVDQTAKTVDNNVVYQIAQMRRLICDFDVHMVFCKTNGFYRRSTVLQQNRPPDKSALLK